MRPGADGLAKYRMPRADERIVAPSASTIARQPWPRWRAGGASASMTSCPTPGPPALPEPVSRWRDVMWRACLGGRLCGAVELQRGVGGVWWRGKRSVRGTAFVPAHVILLLFSPLEARMDRQFQIPVDALALVFFVGVLRILSMLDALGTTEASRRICLVAIVFLVGVFGILAIRQFAGKTSNKE